LGNLRLRCSKHLVAQQPALGVQPFQVHCHLARCGNFAGGQKIHNWIGVIQPSQGIQARRQHKTDMLFIELFCLCAGQFQHRLNCRAGVFSQPLQAFLHNPTAVAGQNSQIRHSSQRCQVKLICSDLWPACLLADFHQ